jgi:hypothetical protein
MAVLSDNDRAVLWAEAMRLMSDAREPCGITKQDLRAALNAIDAWVDANAGAFNTAIPQPARSSLTTAQKARLLMIVVRRRFEVS